MTSGKAFIVVGHRQWGKSTTIRKLHKGKKYWLEIFKNGDLFKIFIRRMSNDDIPKSYLKFIEKLKLEDKPLVIITLCPEFKKQNRKTAVILQKLKEKKYHLFFFVLKYRYNNVEQSISEDEIDALHRFGKVKVYDKVVKSNEGAKAFKEFILKHL